MLKYPPEKEYGNIEYKTKLVNKKEDRINGIATQMRYRATEGSGEAIYVIGVSDNGDFVGVDDDEFTESFNNLSLAADKNSYSMKMLSSRDLPCKKKVYELLIREKNEQKYIDIKVAVAGSVDAGKSSLLGVLTSGKNDDGRGSARLSIFNFKHEVSSGRTSSIAHHILGFDDKGQIMNYSDRFGMHMKGWPEIIKDSSKVISFYDLCGHEKYMRTTILGLTSSFPDLCIILVGANMGITRITQEHIFLCVTMKIPFAIVITKIDICVNRKNVLKETIRSVNKLLKLPGLRRIPYKVNSLDDVIICAKNVRSESIVPIFHVSNVTGVGIDNVKQFLNLLGKVPSNIKDEVKDVVMHIDTTFTVPGVGTVVGGQLISGTIKVGDKMMVGPNDGIYIETQVRSIHCKRVLMQEVNYGSYVCLGLKKIDRNAIRRGNVIISKGSSEIVVSEFDAEITVLKSHSTTIKPGYEPIIHTCTMRQSAKLISIKDKVNGRHVNIDNENDYILRTGDKATAKFRFSYHPEYIRAGDRLLMSEGIVKIVGVVK
jgi:GTPase